MGRLLPVSLLLALCRVALLIAADPSPASDGGRAAAEVEALIRQLGDKSFDVRQAATEQLLNRPDAIPALRRALKADDPEIASRARTILAGLDRRQDKKMAARLADFAKNGEIDQAAELLVRRDSWADEDAAFRVMTDLAGRLIDLGAKEFGEPAVPVSKECLPAGDLTEYLKLRRPSYQVTGRIFGRGDPGRAAGPRWVRAEEITLGLGADDLLVAAEGVRSAAEGGDRGRLEFCVVFSGGPVTIGEPVSNSVIVCDGDFTVYNAQRCLIIARGDVRLTHTARDCRIITSGSVVMGEKDRTAQIKEKQATPLGFVKWFDPASVGVAVETAEGGVKVKKADDGKPFAAAGLRAGDLVTAADGKKVESPDDFRRLVRARVVMGDEMPLEVRRDGKPLRLTVGFLPAEPPKK